MAIWVMDTEGRILYDVNPNPVGLNLFQDKLTQPYAQLISLARTITSQAEGRGSYKFLHDVTQQFVKKSAVWKNVSLYSSD